jgi:hypothetical protein
VSPNGKARGRYPRDRSSSLCAGATVPRSLSSIGRAPARQAGGNGIETRRDRHVRIAQPAERQGRHPCRPLRRPGGGGRRFEPCCGHTAADTLLRTRSYGETEITADYESAVGGSSPPGSTQRSGAQRQSGGPTHRSAQVRVPPDRPWWPNREARSAAVTRAAEGAVPSGHPNRELGRW